MTNPREDTVKKFELTGWYVSHTDIDGAIVHMKYNGTRTERHVMPDGSWLYSWSEYTEFTKEQIRYLKDTCNTLEGTNEV